MDPSELFDNYVQNDNKTIGTVSFSKLLQLTVQLPYIQRLKDNQKIKDIVDYQEAYFKQHKQFNFLSVLSFHFCEEDKKLYLTDGQHRYEAIRKLSQEYCSDSNQVMIELIQVSSVKGYEENYNTFNKNTPLPKFPESIQKNIPEECFLHFETQYPNIWRQSTRPQRPFLNKTHFQEALGYLTEHLTKHRESVNETPLTSEMLISWVETKNQQMKGWSFDKISSIRKLNDPTKLKQKCLQNGGCFLGIVPHVSDECGYEWINEIIKEQTGICVKQKSKKKYKKKIPKKVRDDVWNQYIGVNKAQHPCLCCNKTILDKAGGWEAGHYISSYNLQQQGKPDDISVTNLRPICSGCNKSMGTKNMEDYKQTYYPKKSFFNVHTWIGPS